VGRGWFRTSEPRRDVIYSHAALAACIPARGGSRGCTALKVAYETTWITNRSTRKNGGSVTCRSPHSRECPSLSRRGRRPLRLSFQSGDLRTRSRHLWCHALSRRRRRPIRLGLRIGGRPRCRSSYREGHTSFQGSLPGRRLTFRELVVAAGLKPAAFLFGGERSVQLSYATFVSGTRNAFVTSDPTWAHPIARQSATSTLFMSGEQRKQLSDRHPNPSGELGCIELVPIVPDDRKVLPAMCRTAVVEP
jgi:hypothetical protein